MNIEARPYQARACEAIVKARAGIVKAPAGSGKTIIGALALARWATPRAKMSRRRMVVKVVAHTQDQVGQWQAAFAAVPQIAQACEVSMACYQGAPSLTGADIALFDECHHIAAPEFSKIADGAGCAKWGFSATPERADELAGDVYRLIGPIVCTIPREELLESGKLARARVIIHTPNDKDECVDASAKRAEELERRWIGGARPAACALLNERIQIVAGSRNVPGIQWLNEEAQRQGISTAAPVIALSRRFADKPEVKRKLWNLIMAVAEEEIRSRARWISAQEIGVFGNQKRDDLAVQLANQHANDTVLMLIGKIDHGQELAKRIPNAMVIHSQMRAKDCGMTRKAAIQAFKEGLLNMVLATSLADEGLDVPRANVLILTAGGRSAAKAEQRTARVLRAFSGKTHGVIHDFYDHQHPFLKAQSNARIKLYRSLGYEVVFQQEGELI